MNNNAKTKGMKDYCVTVTAGDIDEIIGGRREEDGQMLQPIKHLSGKCYQSFLPWSDQKNLIALD